MSSENAKLNRFFIDIFSIIIFILFQIDYLLTYLGVEVFKIAKEVNPFIKYLLKMNQIKAFTIRTALLFLIIIFINIKLKDFLKEEKIKFTKLVILTVFVVLLIIFILHTIWLMKLVVNYT